MPFKIAALATGPNPVDWETLEDLLSVEPDWTFQPYAEVVGTLGGGGFGRGFASATWHLNIAHNAQRATLRTFCPGVSAQVYISTPTNEDDSNEDPIFKNFLCTMNWMKGQEDKQIRSTLGVDLTFTHLVEIVEEEEV